jgi:predicted HTH domain antitoxin
MQFEIPDDIVKRAETNGIELRIALAVQLYVDNRIDHADACRLANLPPTAFNRELLSRKIGVQQYPPALGRRSKRSAG